ACPATCSPRCARTSRAPPPTRTRRTLRSPPGRRSARPSDCSSSPFPAPSSNGHGVSAETLASLAATGRFWDYTRVAPHAQADVLPRRPQLSAREELGASQRGRLICAIADSVAKKGYPDTSVADVIALAGVSRRTFYEHFKDKEDCFLAAYDEGAKATYDAMVEAAEGLDDWRLILDAVLTTWLEFPQADLAFPPADM